MTNTYTKENIRRVAAIVAMKAGISFDEDLMKSIDEEINKLNEGEE